MRVSVVAEIASNWEGDLNIARKLIFGSKKAGADAVKFQMWRTKDLYDEKHPDWDVIKKSELTFEKTKKIKKISDEAKIEFFCSAFYPEAVDFLESIGVKKYKVASRTCLFKDPFSYEVLLKKANTRKKIIVSMGMGGNKQKIKKIFRKNQTIFCYCISDYPTLIEKINWKEAIKYDGFSDHTLGVAAPLIYTILKMQQGSKKILIEKHIKLSNSKGPDASTSLDVNDLSLLISRIRKIQKTKL